MLSKEILTSTPHSPGVYLMLDKQSAVLYVGKAKDLFKRLSSYVHHKGGDYSKTRIMLSQVDKVDTILTRTEKEALILEASLIKKHKPKYNVILRDDKNYPYIKVTVQEKWPRVTMSRRRLKDGARYFGPYSSSSAMWATLKLIGSLFPLRQCKGGKLRPRKRPCLNFQMGKCLSPCSGKADPQQYDANVKDVIMVLEGRNTDLIQQLKIRMEKAASDLDYEQAAFIRDQIKALERTLEKQVVASHHTKDQDVIGFSRRETSVAIAFLTIRNGLIGGSRTYYLNDPYGDDPAILSQVINQYYDSHSYLPQELLLPFLPEDEGLISERLSDLRGSRITLLVPQRGDKVKLITMAQANAGQVFAEKEKKEQSWQNLQESIQKKLRLTRLPQRIECFDISNISGKQAVGALVCFIQGDPAKNYYRHYKIKTVEGPDDYSMMAEVLQRRLSRGIEEQDLPDLILVDGGKGQLNIALKVAESLNVRDDIEWLGIAKERDDEGEKLYKPDRKNPIVLPKHNPILLYLMRIRDESHRYGITFHRRLRSKATFTSELDLIPGIGPARKKKLLNHFGSLKRVREASSAEILEVETIGEEMAEQIYHHFHSTE